MRTALTEHRRGENVVRRGCFSRGAEGGGGGGEEEGQTRYMRAREKSDAVENNPTASINTIRHSVLGCASRSSDAYLTRVTSSRGDFRL